MCMTRTSVVQGVILRRGRAGCLPGVGHALAPGLERGAAAVAFNLVVARRRHVRHLAQQYTPASKAIPAGL